MQLVQKKSRSLVPAAPSLGPSAERMRLTARLFSARLKPCPSGLVVSIGIGGSNPTSQKRDVGHPANG